MAAHNTGRYHNAARNYFRKAEYRKDLRNSAKRRQPDLDNNFAALAADNKAAADIPDLDNNFQGAPPLFDADFVDEPAHCDHCHSGLRCYFDMMTKNR